MSNTVGSYSVPVEPTIEDYTRNSNIISAGERMLDGTLRTHFTAAKSLWSGVTWKPLTSTQRDLLMAQLQSLAHIAWAPPEGGSFTVKVNACSWTPLGSDQHYSVTAELEEV